MNLWDLPIPDDTLPPGTADRLSPSATGPYGSLDYVARDIYDRLRASAAGSDVARVLASHVESLGIVGQSYYEVHGGPAYRGADAVQAPTPAGRRP